MKKIKKEEKVKMRKGKKEENKENESRKILILDDEINTNKNTFSLMEVIIIILISILFGFVIGYIITYSKMDLRAKSDSSVGEIVNTYQMIKEEYYDELDEEKLKEATIKAMLNSLGDPYSNYMNKGTTDEFNELTEGNFIGIGVTVSFDGKYNKIIEVMKDYPAYKAGLKENDLIIRVDGVDVEGIYGDDLSNRIRGEKGTDVLIAVLRDDKEMEFHITRDTIEVQSVTSDVLESNIGYLKINNFATNTSKQFEKELKKIEKKNITSLIIDVRDNPGGHLQQTREILSNFFDKKTVLFQVETKKKKTKIKGLNNTVREYPVVVLINNGSASAAEILASCFKENYKKAKIIGMESYGKGTVQKSQSLSSGDSYKFTTQKWLTSKGDWVHNTGIEPDIVVEQVEEYYNNPVRENDAILKKAIETLKES